MDELHVLPQRLDNGWVLRCAASAADVERVAACNASIHGGIVDAMTRSLFLHHPHTRWEDLLFIEEESTGQVISSICLIPWTWRFGDVEISAGEMGIVGTLEPYRGRGLIRAQVAVFKERLRTQPCLLSHIQGIPYYYRQFGYEYALPLEGGLRLESRHIPQPPETRFAFRLATTADIPLLMALYDDAAQNLDISTVRDEAIWRYILEYTVGTDMEREVWIAQDEAGQVAGYFCLPRYHFDEELAVNEVSRLHFEPALAILNHLKALVQERKKPGIRLNLPASCTLMQLARSLGAHDLGTYAWQILVPDWAAFLQALGPVLERRIAASPFAGLTRDVPVSLYREGLRLCFEGGRLSDVVRTENHDAAPIRCPPTQFIPLVFGHRTIGELRETVPDVSVAPPWRLLVDTLFPKTRSFLYTAY